jgi:hypothetical protein
MAGNGPAPKPAGSRRRRNATVAMTQLPAGGRKGRIPNYPLGPDLHTQAKLTVARRRLEALEDLVAQGRDVDQATVTRLEERIEVLSEVVKLQDGLERNLWKQVWRTPASQAWERLKWTHEIALYIRWLVLGEQGDIAAAKEARQLGDRLGLSPLAMLRLRWEIPADEVGERRTGRAEAVPASRRLRAIATTEDDETQETPPAAGSSPS